MTVNNEPAEAAKSAETAEQSNSFEWTRHSASGGELVCDLCPDHQDQSSDLAARSPFASENDLKIHQMQFHINPHYLSPGDRLLAKITSFAVNNDDSVKWVPDFRRFSGLYRCHLCYCVWDTRSSLTSHLSNCRVDEFDVDENDDNAPLKQFRRKKRRRKSGEENGVGENKVDENGVDENKSTQNRVDENGVDQNKVSAKKVDDKDVVGTVTLNGAEKNEGENILSTQENDKKIESEASMTPKVDKTISLTDQDVDDLKDDESTGSFAQKTTDNSEVSCPCSLPDRTEELTLSQNVEKEVSEKTLLESDEKIDNLEKDNCVGESSVDESNTREQHVTSAVESVSGTQPNHDASEMSQSNIVSETSQSGDVSEASQQFYVTKLSICESISKAPNEDADDVTSNESRSSRKRRNVVSQSSPTKTDTDSETKRPERKCKTTTKALMKLTFSDDFDFADDSDGSSDADAETDIKSVDTNSVQTEVTSSVLDEDKTETSSIQSEDVESNASRSHSSAEAKPKRDKSLTRARSIKTVESVTEIRDIMTSSSSASIADDENSVPETTSLVPAESNEEIVSTKSSSTKSKKVSVQSGKVMTKGKRKKKQKNNKKKAKSSSGKSTPMSLRGKSQQNDKPKSAAQQPQQVQPLEIVPPSPSKRVEDVLPDLVPPRNGRQPSRRSTEAEKSAAVIEHVVEMDKHFCCFTCLKYFANFHQFSDHKNSLVCLQVLPTGIERKPETGELTSHGSILNCNSYDACKSRTDRFNDICDDEYSRFTSDAISRVPEFTFNNMHGTVSHIGSIEAKMFRSKPNMSAIEKVKLNISGPWTTKEVWESGGWEIGNTEYLTWQKYENRWSENRRFLMGMSHLPWSEQIRFKKIFDLSLQQKSGKNKKSDEATSGGFGEKKVWSKKQQPLISMLDLRQSSKSVKYMTANEREDAKERLEKQERYEKLVQEASMVSGYLSGEWERNHTFVCGACNANFDELRDALHHKWDDHPYCLVAHFTLGSQLSLPPSGMMYPQTGRGLSVNRSVKVNTKVKKTTGKPRFNCTKCLSSDFADKDAFYIHILECGGEVDWDVTSKKGKKKAKKSKNPGSLKPLRRADSRDGTESDDSSGNNNNNNAAAALKRKQRFERFNRPAPQRDLGVGRFTRLQAEMIRNVKTPKGRKKKKAAAAKASAAAKAARAAKEVVSTEEALDNENATVRLAAGSTQATILTEANDTNVATTADTSGAPSTKYGTTRATKAALKEILPIETPADSPPATPTKTSRRASKAAAKKLSSNNDAADDTAATEEKTNAATADDTAETSASNVEPPQDGAEETKRRAKPVKKAKPAHTPTPSRRSRRSAGNYRVPEVQKEEEEVPVNPEPEETTTEVEATAAKCEYFAETKIETVPEPEQAMEQNLEDVEPKLVENVFELTKLGSESAKTDSELTKAGSESTKTVSESTKTGSESTKTDPELTKTGPESLKTVSEPTKTDSESMKTGSELTKTGSESTKTDPESTKTSPELSKTVSESTKTDSESTKTGSESMKTGSKPANNSLNLTKTGSMSAKIGSENFEKVTSDRKRNLAAVKELMSEMLDKVVKAVAVVSKAEELNLSIDNAKNQLATSLLSPSSASRKRKRKSDAPTRVIHVVDQADDEQESSAHVSNALGCEDVASTSAQSPEDKKPKMDDARSTTNSCAVPTLSPTTKKSILMSALTPASSVTKVPLIKSPAAKLILQGPSEPVKEQRPFVVSPAIQITPSFKPPVAVAVEDKHPVRDQEAAADAIERSRLEIVKDYLSRVALAQAIAKQMMTREIQEPQPASPTMESILEARLLLLSRAQLLQQSPVLQTPISAVPSVPKASTMEELTRGIISENLAQRTPSQLSNPLPVHVSPVMAETRKNEILATLGALHPLPSKSADMTFVKPLSSSVDIFVKPAAASLSSLAPSVASPSALTSPFALASSLASPSALASSLASPSVLASSFASPSALGASSSALVSSIASPSAMASSPSALTSSPSAPASTTSLRMFRKSSTSKGNELPEDLSTKRDIEVTKVFCPNPETVWPTKSEVNLIKPGTSLLKSNLSPKKKKTEPEPDLSISLVPARPHVESVLSRVGPSVLDGPEVSRTESKISVASDHVEQAKDISSPTKQNKRGRLRKTSVQEPVVTSPDPVAAKTEKAGGSSLELEDDEEEMSLSLQRRSRKSASKSIKQEDVKSSDGVHDSTDNVENAVAAPNVDQVDDALSVVPRGRRGRPRKSISKAEVAEISAAFKEDIPKMEVKDPKDLFEFVDEDSLDQQQVMQRNKPFGRSRKNADKESLSVKEVEVDLVPAASDVINPDEKVPGKTEEVSPSKKKPGRPKKKVEEMKDEFFETSKTKTDEASPVETSFNETSIVDEKSFESDSDENAPLKSRKRKNSGKPKTEAQKKAFDQRKDSPVKQTQSDEPPEQVNPYQESFTEAATQAEELNQSAKAAEAVRKRGRPKKVQIAEDAGVSNDNEKAAAKKEENDVFDFNEDEESDDDWLSQDRKLKQKLKEKLKRPRQRSSSYSALSLPESPTLKRERFFSEDSPDAFEPIVPSQCDADANDPTSNNNDETSEKKFDDAGSDVKTEQQEASRGIKRRRSSFANSFYSQAPRRKVLRRTAARLSMQRSSENEALMTAIFDDDSLSNPFDFKDKTDQGDEQKSNEKTEDVKEDVQVIQDEEKAVEPVSPEKQQDEPVNPLDGERVETSKSGQAPAAKEELSIDEEFSRLSDIPDDESFYDSWNRPKRARKRVQTSQVQPELDSNRVVFPLEIRAFAIDQIKNGVTKVQIARELDCPVSTVSGWWNKRDQILQAMSESFPAEVPKCDDEDDVLRPKEPKSAGKGKEPAKKAAKASKPRSAAPKTSRKSPKTKSELLTKGVVDMSTKFDQLLSTSDRASRVTFESTDEDKSTSSDDFFGTPKKVEKESRSTSNKTSSVRMPSTKRNIERIINSKSLSKVDDDEDSSSSESDVAESRDVRTAGVAEIRPDAGAGGVVYEDNKLVFTESEDSDSEDESSKLKVNQGIKNQILKNCFASLAARHT